MKATVGLAHAGKDEAWLTSAHIGSGGPGYAASSDVESGTVFSGSVNPLDIGGMHEATKAGAGLTPEGKEIHGMDMMV